MPELPELQIIGERLTELLTGLTIEKVSVHNHLVVHGLPVSDFERIAIGEKFQYFEADGKFLILSLEHHDFVINPMLTGRVKVETRYKKPTRIDMISIKANDHTLWYSDAKKMGRVYLVPGKVYSGVAGFENRGPSALDPTLNLNEFRERLKHHNGQIKNVLRNQRFIKGIGNAYADEILLYAGINPFRTRASLEENEVEQLYHSMKKILSRIRAILSSRSLDELASEKRDFLMVHNRGGYICPLCGGRVSEVKANRFKTNYCQNCQK
ncbi:hypothetical protein EU527_09720 [Candidatus Thorarchaeota archaeon]|nr:MAG: hypothetical protein EU527_09720 [Candidatus Thorarchaeota archaeon]